SPPPRYCMKEMSALAAPSMGRKYSIVKPLNIFSQINARILPVLSEGLPFLRYSAVARPFIALADNSFSL
ncbi:hypothetical protein, partial [Serratia marcescens]|uniref:hypothetical protein n=1 Tax=Serratia marcescens TaxID=615 RepID=UPI001955372E